MIPASRSAFIYSVGAYLNDLVLKNKRILSRYTNIISANMLCRKLVEMGYSLTIDHSVNIRVFEKNVHAEDDYQSKIFVINDIKILNPNDLNDLKKMTRLSHEKINWYDPEAFQDLGHDFAKKGHIIHCVFDGSMSRDEVRNFIETTCFTSMNSAYIFLPVVVDADNYQDPRFVETLKNPKVIHMEIPSAKERLIDGNSLEGLHDLSKQLELIFYK